MTDIDPALARHDWRLDEIEALFDLAFADLGLRPTSASERAAA
jgi:hypothetical protein